MLAKMARTVERYGMFAGVREIAVAVSGGADSVCLLHALRELTPRWNLRLRVLHVDHGLRGEESRGDAAFVRELAAEMGLPFQAHCVDLSCAAGNLEQAGRRARAEFFAARIAAGDAQRVATGHTLSDQAETVLFRILRGAAGAGLSGIRPVTAEGIVRPLIAVRREEILDYLRRRGIRWREDSTNLSRDFARNRIRHDLLPQLRKEWNPAVAEALAHMADWAFEEERWLEAETARLGNEDLRVEDGAVLLRAGALASLPRAAARRLVRRAVELAKGDLRAVNFGHVEAVLALAADPAGGSVELPGLRVRRSFQWMRFGAAAPCRRWRADAALPGYTPLPGGKLGISLEIVDNSEATRNLHCVYNSGMGCLDRNCLSGSAVLRSWQPGDRYRPDGARGESKLKDLFQKARVPVWERDGWPVLETGGRIAWSRRFG
ncbi:MAG: tRNA lysidine(34) synthetase TilS, partial [Acidobacteriota bacterium]|nr:tRNA lysidine(34) synthetase TilS [Acidobacteriota bacterium]